MRTLKKLWLVGILLVPIGLQTPPAEAQCFVVPFATFSEAVCASACSQGGCNGYLFTNDACYCTWTPGGGGSPPIPEEPYSYPLPPSASLATNPPARGASGGGDHATGGARAIAPGPSLWDKLAGLAGRRYPMSD